MEERVCRKGSGPEPRGPAARGEEKKGLLAALFSPPTWRRRGLHRKRGRGWSSSVPATTEEKVRGG